MPIYEYVCGEGHTTELLRKYDERASAATCACGEPATYVISVPHCVPDGVYSYAPNIGSADAFERRQEHIKNGGGATPKII